MPETLLVTGATGYIASRLIPRLLEAGYTVRCLARRPERLRGRAWYPQVEVASGDVTRPETLPAAMQGVSAAYYLIHSMAAGHGYDRIDLQSARHFGQAAREAGLRQIIYLGGLADPQDPQLALHLKSRIESGRALREAGVPVTEFRAGVIVGPGSVSFEMIRFIAEQFPLMVGPNWLRHRSQPVSTGNVLDYLVAALHTPAAHDWVVELGSLESYSYIEVMSRYAQIRGLKRLPLLLPFVPAWFMAFFIDLLTPVERSYALPLVEGLQNDSLVLDRSTLELFPEIKMQDYPSSVRQALAETHPACMERIWLDREDRQAIQLKHEGMFIDYRWQQSALPPRALMPALQKRVLAGALRLGGLQGFLPDFQAEDMLRVCLTHKLPGSLWLEWKLTPHARGSLIEQTAFFAPLGLPGFISWYLLGAFYRHRLDLLLREFTVVQS